MSDAPTLKTLIRRELVTFRPETAIVDVVATLIEEDISGAPVVDESGALVGVITGKDCFRATLDASYYQGWSGLVSDFMTRDVETLAADLDIVGAAKRFLERPFRRFPVTEEGQLIGIVSRSDILRALNAHLTMRAEK